MAKPLGLVSSLLGPMGTLLRFILLQGYGEGHGHARPCDGESGDLRSTALRAIAGAVAVGATIARSAPGIRWLPAAAWSWRPPPCWFPGRGRLATSRDQSADRLQPIYFFAKLTT